MGRVRELPVRIQNILLAAGVFLGCALAIVLISAVVINSMKNQMVTVAHEGAKEAGRRAGEEIEAVMRTYGSSSLAEVASDPSVRAQLRVMSAEGGVVMAAIFDEQGNCIYQQYGDEHLVRECPLKKGDRIGGKIPGTDGATWELDFREYPAGVKPERLPIQAQGRTVGYIEYGLSEAAALGRLDPLSRHITNSLMAMVVLVIGCLGLSVGLLVKAGNRHVQLQQRHNEAQHLASIGTMASGLAHEIRNPLHAMNLHLDAAREELEDPRDDSPEHVRKVIGNVQNQIRSLNAILTNFMNYALPGRLEMEPIRVATLTGEVAGLLEPELASRGASLVRDVPDDAWITADPTAVRQVLVNVILNAAQAMENSERREIALRAQRAHGGRWTIIVDDTGPGLPQGKEASIFDVFVSHRKGGSGFGLAIARRIVEEHGGAIAGVTRAEGGARFTMDFAAAQEPADYQAVSNRAAAAAPPADGRPAIG